ncbi:hypothetical protein F5876DRAFT_52396 [Lentinula aff. lateritia]|uniref:Uncharacterized protein n=1 Tax=Lentinula aff. lateritia TaxID=2804960 RepID=A0ACC1TKM5_9AGAR|nr:hypothetical protein F5876DRAFT_52396 [Lentinula aff. lateritia]
MVGRAHSERQKHRAHSALVEKYMLQAIDLYKTEHEKEHGMLLKNVCNFIAQQCYVDTKQIIKLSDLILYRRVNNGHSHKEAKEEQRWLNDEEEEVLISKVIYWGD